MRLSDPSAEDALIAALSDTVAMVRRAAALALGAAGTERSDVALANALRDESQLVRYAAERALGTRGSPWALLADLISTDTTQAALHACRAIRSDTTHRADLLPALIGALGPNRPWPTSAEAAQTLEHWGAIGAVGALDALRAARASAEHPYLVQRLDQALERIDNESAGQ